MWSIGVDAHKVKCSWIAKDEDGRVVGKGSFRHTPEGWRTALQGAPKGSLVAVECVGWYQPVFDLLEGIDLWPVLVHARDVALIAKSKKKTDRRDCEILCDLLRSGFLPTAHVPSRPVRELRELTRRLDDVVKTTTAAKNKVHRLLERAWIELPNVTDLFGRAGRRFLETVVLSPAKRVVLEGLLEELDALAHIRERLEQEIAVHVRDDEDVALLLTIDGLSVQAAAVLKAEIDDATRFPNRGSIRSNFGVCTSVRDSADTQRRGRITKQGPGIVRKVLVQGALHFARGNPNAGQKHARLSKTRGKGVARVAAAVDLLDTAYQVLKTRTPYRYASPDRVHRKRRELHRLATRPEPSCVS